MGLDMYLECETYISSFPEGESLRDKLEIKGIEGIDSKKVKSIVEEIGYWRKANAIHKWFVDNIQNGIDDCQRSYVSPEKMKELLSIVNKVLNSSIMEKGKITNGYRIKDGKDIPVLEDGEYIKDPSLAQELLPVTSGFFFGSTDYDQWYVNDLKHTKEILEAAISIIDSDKEKRFPEFYYQSSW